MGASPERRSCSHETRHLPWSRRCPRRTRCTTRRGSRNLGLDKGDTLVTQVENTATPTNTTLTKGNHLYLTFTYERTTKNTVRFAEVVADGGEAAVGTLYIKQTALAAAGVEVTDDLTIEVAINVAVPAAA